jgi:hypothetical protein
MESGMHGMYRNERSSNLKKNRVSIFQNLKNNISDTYDGFAGPWQKSLN